MQLKHMSIGHGKGGVCYLIKNNLKYRPRFISNGISTISIKHTMIIGTYLPHYKKDNQSIFRMELETLRHVIMTNKTLKKDLIIVGDFNVDFLKKPNKHAKLLTNFIIDNQLMVWNLVLVKNVEFTYFKDDDKSYIDHVISYYDMKNLEEIRYVHDGKVSNSDHFGIYIKLKIKIDPNYTYPVFEPKACRYHWGMEYYRNKYEQMMMELTNKLLIDFRRLLLDDLTNDQRNIKFEDLYMILHNSIVTETDMISDEINRKIINGSIKVKPWYNSKLIEMHKICKHLHDSYLKTKNIIYENESRRLGKILRKQLRDAESAYNRSEMVKLDELRYTNSKQFWSIIDNKINPKSMVETEINETKDEFSKIFNEKLVTSDDSEDKYEVDQFMEDNMNIIFDEEINEHEIKNIIEELNNGKSIGDKQVSNEMFKYAKETNIVKIIVIVLTLLINFGCMFNKFNISVIRPIIKDYKKSWDSLNNIRPISISDSIHTIIEKWLNDKINEVYKHVPKQFGFRRGYSCQHAIVTLLEAIKSGKRKKKRVYVCLIDASKAFDKINRYKLWKIMLSFCRPAILRFLIKYYANSYGFISMKNGTSNKFKTTLGVKQGGCLSPLLFAIYIADVVEIIDNLKIGVRVGGQLVNILLYADDIVLLSETKHGMNEMLNAITKYGKTKEIKFNGNKTNLLIFNKKNKKLTKSEIRDETNIKLKLDGEEVIEVEQARYLGFFLDVNSINKTHLESLYSNFANKLSKLNLVGLDKKEMLSKTKSILYKAHLRPLLYYGIDCISLNIGETREIYSTEGNTLKLIHGLYTGILSTELFLALGMDTSENRIKLNKLKLFLRLCRCDYTISILNSIIIENTLIPVKDSIINDVMEFVNYHEWNLEELANKSQIEVNNMINAFKNEKAENVVVKEIKELLEKLPSTKNEIELKLKSYEIVENIEDEALYIGDMQLVDE
jgi:hypothetical protein